ncbi:MAG: ABC transporter substrate-binding protein [Deltaproteobacteria bacterium]|nr:ABC transporter substrate-binding protein [Deltaproteobacteria bacterium]
MLKHFIVILAAVFAALVFLDVAPAQEARIGNPGKSLNFFIFDLARERGFFRDEGLDLKLISIKCDIAVKALLTGDLDATGCVGSASRFIASQNVPIKTVVWLFKKPTFYIVSKPEIKSGHELKGKTVGISSFGSDTDLSIKAFVKLHGLDPERDIKRIVLGPTSTRLAALKGPSIDATPLSPPYHIYTEQMGFKTLAYVGDFLEFPQSGFSVSEAALQNKRTLVKKLIRGTLRGLQLVLENRAETVRFIAKDYSLSEGIADRVYTSILPGLSEDGTATEKGLNTMIESLAITLKKEVKLPGSRLVDYALLKEVQAELGIRPGSR